MNAVMNVYTKPKGSKLMEKCEKGRSRRETVKQMWRKKIKIK
jgi:hypothetical protein